MEPDQSAARGGDLQFDTIEPATDAAAPALRCARCKRPVVATYYEVDAQVTCEACHRQLGKSWSRGTTAKLARAVLYGTGAAIAGGVAYGVISAVTGYHIALISIAVGMFVGFAVRHATGGKGGHIYQIVAAGLTYLAIAGSYVPDVAKGLLQPGPQLDASTSSVAEGAAASPAATPASGVASTNPASPETAAPRTPSPDATGAPPMSAIEALLAIVIFGVIVVAISLAAPILILFDSVGSGLLEILIVGFGVWRAWRMNVAAVPVVAGPFSVRPIDVPEVAPTTPDAGHVGEP